MKTFWNEECFFLSVCFDVVLIMPIQAEDPIAKTSLLLETLFETENNI